ncbi:MAG: hypothetical protein IKV57_07080 [Clostridia bacterium]|nr:hypothetical protein [Clostridia bacterium]
MKRIWIPLVLAVLISLGICVGVLAGDSAVPSLFHNDEAWYKDSVAPLLIKDSRYHVPADMLGMFGNIGISWHREEENLLMTHTDGSYISLLFSTRTAVVNGAIQENVSVFRENGYTYVDVEWVAGIFSLVCEYAQSEDGRMVLRVSDGGAVRSMEELLSRYAVQYAPEEPQTPEPEPDEAEPLPGDGIKRIYIVTDDNYEKLGYVPEEDIVASSGMVCSLFFHARSSDEKLREHGFFGGSGICAGSVEEAEAVNARLEKMGCRRMELVLPAYDSTDREALRQAGYVVLEPDFAVTPTTDPDLMYEELYAWMLENDTAVIRVGWDGCSQRMLALLCNLTANPEWCRADVLMP